MAIRQNPKPDSIRAGIGAVEQARRDLISLSLVPIRQSLTVYADIQRSVFETFSRFSPWGMSILGGSSERVQTTPKGGRNGRATAAEVQPLTATVGRTSRPAAKPAAKKRAATRRPAATKRPATPKQSAGATKPAATNRTAAAKPAATKRTAAAKPAATKRPAAAKRSAAPSTSRRATSQSTPKKPAAKTSRKATVKSAGRAKPAAKKA